MEKVRSELKNGMGLVLKGQGKNLSYGRQQLIALTKMRSSQGGEVATIQGGFGLISRLNALGIISGKRITKVSAMLGQGPITIEIDRIQVAIGFRIASRIMVKLDRYE